jgi:hypothetical protein
LVLPAFPSSPQVDFKDRISIDFFDDIVIAVRQVIDGGFKAVRFELLASAVEKLLC